MVSRPQPASTDFGGVHSSGYMRWPCTSTPCSRRPIPNRFDERAAAGQKVFQREGCVNCHTPPLYTSNRLTLAAGYMPPKDAPATLDVLRLSVGTDPGLALKTRKGTGYYKVPSLNGRLV